MTGMSRLETVPLADEGVVSRLHDGAYAPSVVQGEVSPLLSVLTGLGGQSRRVVRLRVLVVLILGLIAKLHVDITAVMLPV